MQIAHAAGHSGENIGSKWSWGRERMSGRRLCFGSPRESGTGSRGQIDTPKPAPKPRPYSNAQQTNRFRPTHPKLPSSGDSFLAVQQHNQPFHSAPPVPFFVRNAYPRSICRPNARKLA